MDSALRQRIVRVLARFETGDPKVGTGFRLAAGRVLTSQHVIQRISETGKVADAVAIEVAVDLDGKTPVSAPAERLWTGEPKLRSEDLNARDAAVLEDELSAEDLTPFRDLVWQPLDSCAWESAGYARYNPGFEILRPQELTGDLGAIKSEEAYLDLRVDRQTPREGWGGVSGAPVFVAKGPRRGHLYGVVRQNLRRQADTLHAVTLPFLLRDETFRRILGIIDSRGQRERLVEGLRDLFKNKELAEWTARAHHAWAEGWDTEGVEGLLEAMLNQGMLPDVLDELRRLYAERGGRNNARADAFREAATWLAPLVGGRSVECRSEDPSAQRLSLETASPNLAEVGVAAEDGKPVQFDSVPGDLPWATLRAPLETTLEGGAGHEQRVRDQEKLVEDYLFNVMNQYPWIFPSHVKQLERLPPAKKREKWIEAVRLRLRRIAQSHERLPYIVADHEFREAFGDQAAPFLETLKQVFPELRHVELDGDPDNRYAEDDQLEPLWEILRLRPEDYEP